MSGFITKTDHSSTGTTSTTYKTQSSLSPFADFDTPAKVITKEDRITITKWYFDEQALINNGLGAFNKKTLNDLPVVPLDCDFVRDSERLFKNNPHGTERYGKLAGLIRIFGELNRELIQSWAESGHIFKASWSDMSGVQREVLVLRAFLMTSGEKDVSVLRKFVFDFDVAMLLEDNGQEFIGYFEEIIGGYNGAYAATRTMTPTILAVFKNWAEATPKSQIHLLDRLRWMCTTARAVFATSVFSNVLRIFSDAVGNTTTDTSIVHSSPLQTMAFETIAVPISDAENSTIMRWKQEEQLLIAIGISIFDSLPPRWQFLQYGTDDEFRGDIRIQTLMNRYQESKEELGTDWVNTGQAFRIWWMQHIGVAQREAVVVRAFIQAGNDAEVGDLRELVLDFDVGILLEGEGLFFLACIDEVVGMVFGHSGIVTERMEEVFLEWSNGTGVEEGTLNKLLWMCTAARMVFVVEVLRHALAIAKAVMRNDQFAVFSSGVTRVGGSVEGATARKKKRNKNKKRGASIKVTGDDRRKEEEENVDNEVESFPKVKLGNSTPKSSTAALGGDEKGAATLVKPNKNVKGSEGSCMDDATVSKQDENAIKKIKKAKKNKRRGIASKAAHKARREEERELARLVKDGAESCITTSTIPDDCFLQDNYEEDNVDQDKSKAFLAREGAYETVVVNPADEVDGDCDHQEEFVGDKAVYEEAIEKQIFTGEDSQQMGSGSPGVSTQLSVPSAFTASSTPIINETLETLITKKRPLSPLSQELSPEDCDKPPAITSPRLSTCTHMRDWVISGYVDDIRILNATLEFQQWEFKREREDINWLAKERIEKARANDEQVMTEMRRADREKRNRVRAEALKEIEDLETEVEVEVNKAREYAWRVKAEAILAKEQAEKKVEALRKVAEVATARVAELEQQNQFLADQLKELHLLAANNPNNIEKDRVRTTTTQSGQENPAVCGGAVVAPVANVSGEGSMEAANKYGKGRAHSLAPVVVSSPVYPPPPPHYAYAWVARHPKFVGGV